MPYMLARHKVEDYVKWKSGFDEGAALREACGSKGGFIFRNADDPNEVFLLLESDSLDKLRQHAQSEDLKEAMQQSGVIDEPDMYFVELDDRPAV